MEQFPHLKFVKKLEGQPRYNPAPNYNQQTEQNKRNRVQHSEKLLRWTTNIKSEWNNSYSLRENENLTLLNKEVIPILLQINPDIFNIQFDLEKFGIEIISEEDNGFIIGASIDNFRTLEAKIQDFQNSVYGSTKIADFWQITEGNREAWRPEHILSESLFSRWHKIDDSEMLSLEVSISFDKPIGIEPDSTKSGGVKRLEKYRRKLQERDDLMIQRQDDFESFINHYGEIISSIVELEDSFGCEIQISGKGLKDLVLNYPFVFEVVEIEEIKGGEGGEGEIQNNEIEILAPEIDSIEIGVIDSGIMENNKYIADAINTIYSRSYIDGILSCADHVMGGGHGTKVAGAILFPQGISKINSPYQLPFLIRNLRVLDDNCELTHKYPAELMNKIVEDNLDCKLYNLSIASKKPFEKKHMSTWSTMIDKLTHEKDVLFLVSVGNIYKDDIKNYLSSNIDYPTYLDDTFCNIANPSQSSFAISVGSVNSNTFEDNDWKSIGGNDQVSAYSRVGTGIWGHIKPDVVEYGGGLVVSKDGFNRVKDHIETSIELIRSTLHGGYAFGKDSSGTSYSTPKVAYIAAMLKKLYPNEGINLIRSLIVQGARHPLDHFRNPSSASIKYYGYGIPSLERVTRNNEHRVTFYNTGKIKADQAHIYSLNIPIELRGQADDYEILVEVTLAYTSKVRRTRQKTKSYLGTWLDWTVSRLDENFEDFSTRSLKITHKEEEVENETSQVIQWKIRERSNWGSVKDITRNNSTLQKDWAILKSYDLPDELSFAVRGHKGWDKNKEEIPYALTVSIEILGANIPIYESIKIENEIEIESQT